MASGKPPKISLTRASNELATRDRVMRRLFEQAGPCRFGPRGGRSHFQALARSIVFQQLQGKAAAAIHARFVAAVSGDVTPEVVAGVHMRKLRGAGLSAAKATSIRDLARKTVAGHIDLARVARRDDEAVIEQLVQVRGIGRWTAQMFLMFQLRRLDVWPILDYGVRKGYAIAYALDEMPTAKQLEPLGESFRPYRSVAAWYCWRATETA